MKARPSVASRTAAVARMSSVPMRMARVRRMNRPIDAMADGTPSGIQQPAALQTMRQPANGFSLKKDLRRPYQAVIDDKADGVRADIDDGEMLTSRGKWFACQGGCHASAFALQNQFWQGPAAIKRAAAPERLGFVIKKVCAENGSSPSAG